MLPPSQDASHSLHSPLALLMGGQSKVSPKALSPVLVTVVSSLLFFFFDWNHEQNMLLVLPMWITGIVIWFMSPMFWKFAQVSIFWGLSHLGSSFTSILLANCELRCTFTRCRIQSARDIFSETLTHSPGELFYHPDPFPCGCSFAMFCP